MRFFSTAAVPPASMCPQFALAGISCRWAQCWAYSPRLRASGALRAPLRLASKPPFSPGRPDFKTRATGAPIGAIRLRASGFPSTLAAIFMLAHPMLGLRVLTALLVAYLIGEGLRKIAVSLRKRPPPVHVVGSC